MKEKSMIICLADKILHSEDVAFVRIFDALLVQF